MAKLNFSRDVSPILASINTIRQPFKGTKLSLRDVDSGLWRLTDGDTEVYTGTLRECYCMLIGIEFGLNN